MHSLLTVLDTKSQFYSKTTCLKAFLRDSKTTEQCLFLEEKSSTKGLLIYKWMLWMNRPLRGMGEQWVFRAGCIKLSSIFGLEKVDDDDDGIRCEFYQRAPHTHTWDLREREKACVNDFEHNELLPTLLLCIIFLPLFKKGVPSLRISDQNCLLLLHFASPDFDLKPLVSFDCFRTD